MVEAPSLVSARILTVDDDPLTVRLLEELLAEWGYRNVVSTTEPQQVVGMVEQAPPDLVVLDLMMPGLDGFGVLERLERWTQGCPPVPVLVLTADDGPEAKQRALSAGARDFLTKPFDVIEVRLRVQNLLHNRMLQVRLGQHNEALEHRVDDRTRELDHARLEVLERLARAGEYRDDDTYEHAERVGRTAAQLAQRLGAPDDEVAVLRLAATLHDIGKIGISDTILLKPGRLSVEEFEVIKRHTLIGADLLAGSAWDVLQVAADVARSHHERWDGRGYPHGLSGDAIAHAARFVAVADVFDALTHDRPYKRAWPLDRAVAEIHAGSGTQFDPDVVGAFATLDHRALLAPIHAITPSSPLEAHAHLARVPAAHAPPPSGPREMARVRGPR